MRGDNFKLFNVPIEIDGIWRPELYWLHYFGLSEYRYIRRLKMGYSPKEALTGMTEDGVPIDGKHHKSRTEAENMQYGCPTVFVRINGGAGYWAAKTRV